MSKPRLHWLVRLYPAPWRSRYGEELDQLIRERGAGPRAMLDLLRHAAIEHMFNPSGLGGTAMQTYRGSVMAMARHPSAYVPLILSGAALALLLGYLAFFGVQQSEDEGPAARLYQLILLAEFLLIGWFALRWVRTDLRAGLTVIAVQVLAIGASFVPLLLLEA